MCLICVDYQANKLTSEEAFNNLEEMAMCDYIDEAHQSEVLAMILDKEMDSIWNDLEVKLATLFV